MDIQVENLNVTCTTNLYERICEIHVVVHEPEKTTYIMDLRLSNILEGMNDQDIIESLEIKDFSSKYYEMINIIQDVILEYRKNVSEIYEKKINGANKFVCYKIQNDASNIDYSEIGEIVYHN